LEENWLTDFGGGAVAAGLYRTGCGGGCCSCPLGVCLEVHVGVLSQHAADAFPAVEMKAHLWYRRTFFAMETVK
jgi:hypothetical protein